MMNKKILFPLLAVICLLLARLSSAVWGGPAMKVIVVGNSKDVAVEGSFLTSSRFHS